VFCSRHKNNKSHNFSGFQLQTFSLKIEKKLAKGSVDPFGSPMVRICNFVAFQTPLGIQIRGNITKIFVRTIFFTDQTKTFEH